MTTTARDFTARQVRKLLASSPNTEVRGQGRDWEIECSSDAARKRVRKAIQGLGGYKTGYGSWILSANYESPGDWNDKSSRCHY